MCRRERRIPMGTLAYDETEQEPLGKLRYDFR